MAVADKFLLKGQTRVYRLHDRVGGAELLATQWGDTRIINELWIHDPYLREHKPAGPVQAVVDIGANRGYFAVQAALRHPRATVFAFEPDTRNLELLHANVALNGLAERIQVQPAALVPDDRTEVVLYEAIHPGYHTTVEPDDAAEQGITSWRYTGRSHVLPARNVVEALREVVAAHGAVDVLKIDTEGTELDLLAAIPDDLWAAVGYAVAEIPKDPPADLRATWERSGFRVRTEPGYLFLER